MSNLCLIYVLFMLYSCPIHVLSMFNEVPFMSQFLIYKIFMSQSLICKIFMSYQCPLKSQSCPNHVHLRPIDDKFSHSCSIHLLFSYASFMSHSCLIHILFICYSCPIHVPFMSHSCPIHVPFMSHSCPIHVPFMSHSCPFKSH